MQTHELDRRDFLKESLVPAAVPWLAATAFAESALAQKTDAAPFTPEIIDTNVHLFDWPFRQLKFTRPAELVAKLRKHRITQAWAGNFQAVLHKNLDAANARLAEACRAEGDGMLIPFGSVNPVWPDWEEDLRRCHEAYRMPGIRLYPNYHNYRLDRPEFVQFLKQATDRGLLVQIAVVLEDDRVHHPVINVPPVEAGPLIAALKQVPQARVQLLNVNTALRANGASALVAETNIVFDIAHIEAVGALGRLIDGNHWSIRPQVLHTRLLFGSHTPYAPCEAALLRLVESPLEKEQLLAIMQGNARKLLSKS